MWLLFQVIMHFYPRSPCGERHLRVLDGSKSSIISIHALLAESDAIDVFLAVWTVISIHALLAESDRKLLHPSRTRKVFLSTLSLRRATVCVHWFSLISLVFLSTLSLRRATCQWRRSVKLFQQFLSTLSLRRATACMTLTPRCFAYFYPRSPCGERLMEM